MSQSSQQKCDKIVKSLERFRSIRRNKLGATRHPLTQNINGPTQKSQLRSVTIIPDSPSRSSCGIQNQLSDNYSAFNSEQIKPGMNMTNIIDDVEDDEIRESSISNNKSATRNEFSEMYSSMRTNKKKSKFTRIISTRSKNREVSDIKNDENDDIEYINVISDDSENSLKNIPSALKKSIDENFHNSNEYQNITGLDNSTSKSPDCVLSEENRNISADDEEKGELNFPIVTVSSELHVIEKDEGVGERENCSDTLVNLPSTDNQPVNRSLMISPRNIEKTSIVCDQLALESINQENIISNVEVIINENKLIKQDSLHEVHVNLSGAKKEFERYVRANPSVLEMIKDPKPVEKDENISEEDIRRREKRGKRYRTQNVSKALRKSDLSSEVDGERSLENSSTPKCPTFKIWMGREAESEGIIPRRKTKKAQDGKIKKGRKKKNGKSDEWCRVERVKSVGGKKRGRPKSIQKISTKSDVINQDTSTLCCLEGRCCSVFGCIHGNRDKELQPRELPSLPDNMEYIFSEKQFYQRVQKFQVIQENNSPTQEVDADRFDSTYVSAAKAEILYDKPRIISGDKGTDGKKAFGFRVPLVEDSQHSSSDPESRDETADSSSSTKSFRDTFPDEVEKLQNLPESKPKIIEDEILPKGTVYHVLSGKPTKIATTSTTTGRSRNENGETTNYETKDIPYSHPGKRKRISLYSAARLSDPEIDKIRHSNPIEMDKLFVSSPTHRSSLMSNRKVNISSTCSSAEKKDHLDYQGNINNAKSLLKLTRKNLRIFDGSNNCNNYRAEEPNDIVTHIISTMQRPTNQSFEINNSVSKSESTFSSNMENLKGHSRKEEKIVKLNRKRVGGRTIENESEELGSITEVKKPRFNHNNDLHPHSDNSEKLCGLWSDKAGDSANRYADNDNSQLITAWLGKYTNNNDVDVVDNQKDEESNHSFNSAQTIIRSPLLVPAGNIAINNNNNTLTESNFPASIQPGLPHNSNVTEKASGAEEHKSETRSETMDGVEPISKKNENRDEEMEDYLHLDYEEDDLSSNASAEKSHGTPSAVTVSNNVSPKRSKDLPVSNSSPTNDHQESNPSMNNSSMYHQMSNFDKYASQTRREFNDQYYGYSMPNEPLRHEADDLYDPYEPVEQSNESTTNVMHFPKEIKLFFRGLCFSHLKTGVCARIDCPFHNDKYTVHLQNLPRAPCRIIEAVLSYALEQYYFHFLSDMYPQVIKRFELRGIQSLCSKIKNVTLNQKTGRIFSNGHAFRFYQDSMKPTVDALLSKGHTIKTIIGVLEGCFLFPSDENRKRLMRVCVVSKNITPGQHWETLESLIKPLQDAPPEFVTKLILQDCKKFQKSHEYLMDVYQYVIKKIPPPMRASLDGELLEPFESFTNENMISTRPAAAAAAAAAAAQNVDIIIQSPNERYENGNDIFPTVGRSLATQKKSIKQRLGRPKPLLTELPKISEAQNPLELIPIDCVDKPKSIYGRYLWKLHADLFNVEKSLKHGEYSRVIDTFTSMKNQKNQPFAEGFYNLLCATVLTCTQHVKAIVKLTGDNFFRKSSTGRYRIVNN